MATQFDEFRQLYIEYVKLFTERCHLEQIWDINYGRYDVTDLEEVKFKEVKNEVRVKLHKIHEELKALAILITWQMLDVAPEPVKWLSFIQNIQTFIDTELENWEKNLYGSLGEDFNNNYSKEFLFIIKFELVRIAKMAAAAEVAQPKNVKQKKEKPKSIKECLTAEGKILLPKLIKEYKNSKPAEIAYMWHALYDLSLVADNISNISELHRLLMNDFGDIGVYYRFSTNLKSLKKGATKYQDSQIQEHIERIKSL